MGGCLGGVSYLVSGLLFGLKLPGVSVHSFLGGGHLGQGYNSPRINNIIQREKGK